MRFGAERGGCFPPFSWMWGRRAEGVCVSTPGAFVDEWEEGFAV